jgi:hypothetical protein
MDETVESAKTASRGKWEVSGKAMVVIGIVAIILSLAGHQTDQHYIQAGLNCEFITKARAECEAFPNQVWIDRCEFGHQPGSLNATTSSRVGE